MRAVPIGPGAQDQQRRKLHDRTAGTFEKDRNMGSPIASWDGAEAYFTGFGGYTPALFLIAAIAFTIGAIVYGSKHESEAYERSELD